MRRPFSVSLPEELSSPTDGQFPRDRQVLKPQSKKLVAEVHLCRLAQSATWRSVEFDRSYRSPFSRKEQIVALLAVASRVASSHLPQPHPRLIAIGELHAGGFEGGADGGQASGARLSSSFFKIDDEVPTDIGTLREASLIKFDQSARGQALGWRYGHVDHS
jgi:hypothetical protein